MGNRTVTRRLFWQPRLSTRTVRTVGDALPETRVCSRTGEMTANNAIRVPRGAIPPPREASSAVPSNPPAAMKHHRSSDGSTVDRIAVGATASTDDARAVGGACGANPIPVIVPCHRVVGANGSLTGFSGGMKWKVRLLRIEGIELPLH